MKNNSTDKESKQLRFSDQELYYLDHLKKQKKAMRSKFSILGRHHNNLDNFVRGEIVKLPLGSRVLDAGCGLSAWTTKKLRNRYNISGIDGEPDAISLCRKLYRGQDYRVGDLYNLKYKKNFFDALVMREVIEHFKTPGKAVREAYEVLKPGGILILTTPNYDSLLLHFIEHTYNRFFGGPCKPYRDDVHPSKFKPNTLRRTLGKYFAVAKIKTIDYGISMTCVARKRR